MWSHSIITFIRTLLILWKYLHSLRAKLPKINTNARWRLMAAGARVQVACDVISRLLQVSNVIPMRMAVISIGLNALKTWVMEILHATHTAILLPHERQNYMYMYIYLFLCMAWNDDAQANDDSKQHWWRHDVNYTHDVIHIRLLKQFWCEQLSWNVVYDVANIS